MTGQSIYVDCGYSSIGVSGRDPDGIGTRHPLNVIEQALSLGPLCGPSSVQAVTLDGPPSGPYPKSMSRSSNSHGPGCCRSAGGTR